MPDIWVAQLVECLTSAQVMISRFVSSSPASGLLLSAQSPLWIFCPPLSLPIPDSCILSLSLSLSKINKHLKKCFKGIQFLEIPSFINKTLFALHHSFVGVLKCYDAKSVS